MDPMQLRVSRWQRHDPDAIADRRWWLLFGAVAFALAAALIFGSAVTTRSRIADTAQPAYDKRAAPQAAAAVATSAAPPDPSTPKVVLSSAANRDAKMHNQSAPDEAE
jgi:hypothetical protein